MRFLTYIRTQLHLLEIIFFLSLSQKRERERESDFVTFVHPIQHPLTTHKTDESLMTVTLNTTTRRSTFRWEESGEVLVNIKKSYRETKGKARILTKSPNRGKQLTSCPSCFHLQRGYTTHWNGGCLIPISGLDVLEKCNIRFPSKT